MERVATPGGDLLDDLLTSCALAFSITSNYFSQLVVNYSAILGRERQQCSLKTITKAVFKEIIEKIAVI